MMFTVVCFLCQFVNFGGQLESMTWSLVKLLKIPVKITFNPSIQEAVAGGDW